MNPLLSFEILRILYLLSHRVVEGNLDGKIPDISSIRVWSVPSITVTMSLDDVKVTVDDELVTIEESKDDINIYLQEGTHQSRQTEVTHELVKYFKEQIGFDEESTALIILLMGAPTNRLPGILDKHNIPLPEGSHDDVDNSSGEETPDPEDYRALDGEDNIHLDNSDDSHDSRGDGISGREDSLASSDGTGFTPTESGTGIDSERRRRSCRTIRAARRDHPAPLRDLIPSHQSLSKSIIRRARDFRLSDAEAAVSIQDHSESRAAPLRFSLPIRIRTSGNDTDENEYPSPPGVPTTGGSHHRSFGAGDGGAYSSLTSRRESSGATSGGRADDPNEIRARGIGFLGELFVNDLSH